MDLEVCGLVFWDLVFFWLVFVGVFWFCFYYDFKFFYLYSNCSVSSEKYILSFQVKKYSENKMFSMSKN